MAKKAVVAVRIFARLQLDLVMESARACVCICVCLCVCAPFVGVIGSVVLRLLRPIFLSVVQ